VATRSHRHRTGTTGPASVAAFFRGRRVARRLFTAVNAAVTAAGPSTMRVTRSQISFRRNRGFAWAWTPDRWLRPGHVASLVLSIALPRRVRSKRWKEVVEPRPRQFMHHLERYDVEDIDQEVRGWLREAWAGAA
jgi:hypothetical protein